MAVTTLSLTKLDYFSVYNQLVFGFIAFLGNTVLLIAMKRQGLFENPGYLTLAHFSVCDFLNAFVAVFYTPFAIITKSTHIMYLGMGFVLVVAEFSRKVFIVFMSISRFWVIVFPISGKLNFDLRLTKKYLIVVWAMCVAVSMPFLITVSACFFPQRNKWGYCPWGPGWLSTLGLAINFVASGLMICLYPLCFYKIVKQSRQFERQQASPGPPEEDEGRIPTKEKNILYIFCITAVVFTLSWLPSYYFYVVGYKLPFASEMYEFMRGVQTAYNPFMYYLCNPSIKAAVKGVFKKEPQYHFSPNLQDQEGL